MALRVAFVGVRRTLESLPSPDYLWTFVRYHLELPWYFGQNSDIEVTLTLPDIGKSSGLHADWNGQILSEREFREDGYGGEYDVVVHWRKWFPDLYTSSGGHRLGNRNLLLCQDHSFSQEWKDTVRRAHADGQLDGILTFPGWHRQNTSTEVGPDIPLYAGFTLGVDTHVYRPDWERKDPYHLLWASDPGRGLERTLEVFHRLWAVEHRFHLTVTYPDYVDPAALRAYRLDHPGIRVLHGLRNGPELRDLFNTAGFIPYASSFQEPSSRVHRQGQAAGCVVLYPPDMGTPSELIEDRTTGVVCRPGEWPGRIFGLIGSGEWRDIGAAARKFAETEDWAVQSRRFYERFKGAGE